MIGSVVLLCFKALRYANVLGLCEMLKSASLLYVGSGSGMSACEYVRE